MNSGLQVKIESMAFGGYGVARVDGKVLFIPYAVTGDEVRIEVTGEKKRYSMGRVVGVVEPSPWRVPPPCPHFGVCGGCQWQHIDNSSQGEMKRAILCDLLKRLGSLDKIPPVDVVPSPKPYGYRVRVQLKVRGKAFGYYQEGTRRIIDISHCPISHPLINRIILILRGQPDGFSNMEEIEINVSPEEEKGVLLLHPLHPHSHDRRFEHFAKQFLQSQPVLQGIGMAAKRGWTLIGDPSLSLTVPFPEGERERNLSFRISPGSFSQVNPEQNQKLIDTVLEFSGVKNHEKVLDLYAGVGNLTLPLAVHAGEVFGVEESRIAVKDATVNMVRNGVRNARFIEGEVAEVLKDWKSGRPDQVVLDPPRTGCKKVVDRIAGLDPGKIIYVSCEPSTFARDLRLFHERGYSLRKLRLIDMFPQTYHMEVVGLLTH
jgi:23S rRNA (uracil1939-C5)-methyltransferase